MTSLKETAVPVTDEDRHKVQQVYDVSTLSLGAWSVHVRFAHIYLFLC